MIYGQRMKSKKPVTVAIVSLGCPKNLVDSERMLAILAEGGCVVGAPLDGADVAVINTCGFLSSACEESLEVIGEALALRRAGRLGRVVVAGCMPSRLAKETPDILPDVDAVIGVNDRDGILSAVLGGGPRVRCSGRCVAVCDAGRFRLTPRHTAYLRLAEGCSARCTFCTIPDIRGPLRSKAPEQVLAEARELIADGARELNLIAQDTTAYGSDLGGGVNLSSIIRELNRISRLRWIRLMYAYPSRFDDELIETMAACDKTVKYVDMPLQHISGAVLKRMGRRITAEQTVELLRKMRSAMPGIAIRTTMMTGFPGETDADFAQLLQFVKDFKFDALGVFEYSPERGTPAARMKGQIAAEVKAARARELMRVQRRIAASAARRRIGQDIEVVVDGTDANGQCFGRAAFQAPEIDGVCLLTKRRRSGQWLMCSVVGSKGYDLVVEPR